MSKRTQSIRSMFASKPEEVLSADNAAASPRVTAGAVKSLKETFSGVERDYQDLRDQLTKGLVAVELDPALIDPSPFADRFAEPSSASFETLKQSIAERGQEIPVLVREHPTVPNRYQSAYGHRRVRALRELGRPVRAFVRALSDEDLVVAQGLENSSREDLSFIERVAFALKLEMAGFRRAVIQSALSIDRAEASKLILVARGIPDDVIQAIGRAPKIGRGRWLALVESLRGPDVVRHVRAILATPKVKAMASDDRFAAAVQAARHGAQTRSEGEEELVARADDGRQIGKLTWSANQCRIQLDRSRDRAFAAFLMRKLPELYATYIQEEADDQA